MDPDAVVVISLILVATVIVILALNIRHKKHEMLHKERMAALEKGMALPLPFGAVEAPAAARTPQTYLLRGMIWLFTGLGLTVFLFFFISAARTEDLGTRLWRAQQLRERGATEEQVKEFLAEKGSGKKGVEGLASLGLIPMGVGLAYLLFYSSEKKRMKPLPGPDASGDSS